MEKTCIKCKTIKPLTEYYKHSQMADGHLNKCISCSKKEAKLREDKLREDPVFVQKEKDRAIARYHRLNYKDKHRPTPERKREIQAKYKKSFPEIVYARNHTSHMKANTPGNHLHHWSYNKEHAKDVIELTPSAHSLIHRYMVYDPERMMYRRCDNFMLLYNREVHELFINEILLTNESNIHTTHPA